MAARGELDPFILVVEGSIPDETNKAEGYWATFGTDPVTGQPIPTCDWIDRLAPKPGRLWPRAPARRTAESTPWRAIPPAAWVCPTISAGTGDRRPGMPIVCIPGCPVQPDNMTETLLYLLHQAVGRAP